MAPAHNTAAVLRRFRSSFPRFSTAEWLVTRESSVFDLRLFSCNLHESHWIPAFAGMTNILFVRVKNRF
jgi:hypothetical protein